MYVYISDDPILCLNSDKVAFWCLYIFLRVLKSFCFEIGLIVIVQQISRNIIGVNLRDWSVGQCRKLKGLLRLGLRFQT